MGDAVQCSRLFGIRQPVGLAGVIAQPPGICQGARGGDTRDGMISAKRMEVMFGVKSLKLAVCNRKPAKRKLLRQVAGTSGTHRNHLGYQLITVANAIVPIIAGQAVTFHQFGKRTFLLKSDVGFFISTKQITVKPGNLFLEFAGLMGDLPYAVRLIRKPQKPHGCLSDLLQGAIVFPSLVTRHGPVFASEKDDGRSLDLIHPENRGFFDISFIVEFGAGTVPWRTADIALVKTDTKHAGAEIRNPVHITRTGTNHLEHIRIFDRKGDTQDRAV